MGIALVIVIGVTLMTAIASGFDYLGKRSKRVSKGIYEKVDILEKKVLSLESVLDDKDERISQLEKEVTFMSRLLEDKSPDTGK